MILNGHLGTLLPLAAGANPDGIAVEDESGRAITYRELDRMAGGLAATLRSWEIGPGDRVGLALPKTIEGVVAIHGILRAGAAYVPIDATAPLIRGAGILADAGVKAVIAAGPLIAAWPGDDRPPRFVAVGQGGEALPWDEAVAAEPMAGPPGEANPDDVAYLLYTSGSTGRPKGVVLTHGNAFAFLDWCEAHLGLRDGDRFASHAPFHFDLSIFDLYAPARRASPLLLVGESTGKDPAWLGTLISDRRVDVWYSAPSILALLTTLGGLDQPDRRAPRLVLFAGEVFPIEPLRRLRALWPEADLWNLYGPTETNVCHAQPIPRAIPADRVEPFPIGRVCEPHRCRVVDELLVDVPPGAVGELLVAGPGVMVGYLGRPDLDAAAFVDDAAGRWYRTGDLVAVDEHEVYRFHGRRDRMVKRRGHRIELGEIEAVLGRHPDVAGVAVTARGDGEAGVTIVAHVALRPGAKRSILAMKRHSAEGLPLSMVPDGIAFLDALPLTSTAKVDYQALAAMMDPPT